MTQELAVREQGFHLPDNAREQLAEIAEFQIVCRELMIEGVDYGPAFPGSDKPSLLKPGAEKLIRLLGLSDDYEVESTRDYEKGFYSFLVKCRLTHSASGQLVSTGLGECNSMEARYRYRNGSRSCPSCGNTESIIKGKAEYGGGWVCFSRKGGCGDKFPDGDPSIENQPVGKILNDDIHSQVNTILKISKKRSLVDAALSVGRLSGIFTQDAEDMIEQLASSPVVNAAPAQRQRAQQPTAQPPQGRGGNARPSARSGSCAAHGKPWGATEDGSLGHPLGDGTWCWKDAQDNGSEVEAPTQAEPVPQSSEGEELEQEVQDLGWRWDEFQEAVLKMSWADFVKLGGDREKALEQLAKHMDEI